MAPSVHTIDHPAGLPISAHLGAERPFRWLRRGWEDFRANPRPSIAQSILLVAMGWLILLFCSANLGLLAAAVSGFLLVAPVFAAGFYELSRLRSAGENPTLDRSIQGAVKNGKRLAALGLVLAVLTVAWAWLSTVLFEHTLGHALAPMEWSTYQYHTMMDWELGTSFLVTYLLTGAALALLAFVLSAVAAPMLFDRSVSAPDAILTSVRVVFANPVAMAVWAVLIAVLTLIGFATMLFGLIVILPVLGHATWHAYRDLVDVSSAPPVRVAQYQGGAGFWDVH